jgi:hypothetical protein
MMPSPRVYKKPGKIAPRSNSARLVRVNACDGCGCREERARLKKEYVKLKTELEAIKVRKIRLKYSESRRPLS